MKHNPRILVCTDFSSYSDEALRGAALLAKKSSSGLSVLHVSEHPAVWGWLPSEGSPISLNEKLEREMMSSLRQKLEEQLSRLGIEAENHISMGIPANVILEEVEARKIDILVMGHRGKNEGPFRIGSLAEKIIAASPIPVMVIKSTFRTENVGALLDPTGSMEDILTWSESISNVFGSRLKVISLFPDLAARFIGIGKLGFSTELLSLNQEQAREVVEGIENRIRNHLKKEAALRIEISREKKLSYHLNSIMESENIDLAVMKRHQAGFLEKLMIGSETRRMLEIYHRNLLILPP